MNVDIPSKGLITKLLTYMRWRDLAGRSILESQSCGFSMPRRWNNAILDVMTLCLSSYLVFGIVGVVVCQQWRLKSL